MVLREYQQTTVTEGTEVRLAVPKSCSLLSRGAECRSLLIDDFLAAYVYRTPRSSPEIGTINQIECPPAASFSVKASSYRSLDSHLYIAAPLLVHNSLESDDFFPRSIQGSLVGQGLERGESVRGKWETGWTLEPFATRHVPFDSIISRTESAFQSRKKSFLLLERVVGKTLDPFVATPRDGKEPRVAVTPKQSVKKKGSQSVDRGIKWKRWRMVVTCESVPLSCRSS